MENMTSRNLVWVVGGLTVAPLLYHFLKSRLKDYLVEHGTILHDIPFVGTPRKNDKIRGTAVICGGSCADTYF